MGMFTRKLRIGEKIGFGFGVVGLLFLAVIWQYHNTLQGALTEYRRLHDVFGTRKAQALGVENLMLRAQRSEKNFILTREEGYARDVQEHLDQALETAASMGTIDSEVAPIAERMARLISAYGQRFSAVVEAWRIRGLDHNSGLQGAFRDSVHELEDMAGQLEVDRLYLLLLQIRRGEKDLGLRREDQYRERVLQLIQDFSDEVASSGLDDGLKARLFHEIEVYRETFGEYAAVALGDSDISGGKGPFRQAAHRIERLLEAHYLPGLGERILQVRRREKDYLLRHDKQYVDMAIGELDRIAGLVEASAISAEDKARFTLLLTNYRQDFLALVAQNDRIAQLHDEMRTAVGEIAQLAEDNVEDANRAMKAVRASIDDSTTGSERAMFWVVAAATILGIFLAFAITLPIVRPLRKMAGLLDQLASEEPAERMAFFPEGRDEVNAMAGSVNAIADHKASFIRWWKATMTEADACARLEDLMNRPHSTADREEAEDDIRQSLRARQALSWEHYQKVHQLNQWIIERAEGLLKQAPSGRTETDLNAIRYSARSVQTLLEMTSVPQIRVRTPA